MAWGLEKLARIGTGAATLGASELLGWDRTKDLALGQKASDVELPDEIKRAQEQRQTLIDALSSRGPRNEAQGAARLQAKLLSNQAAAQAASAAARGRGFGALAALQGAEGARARAQGQIAEQGGLAALRGAAQDVAATQQDQAMLANLIGQQEQSALAAQQFREAMRRKGLLGVLGSAAGGAIGTMYGGPQGGAAGAQLGYGFGQAFER